MIDLTLKKEQTITVYCHTPYTVWYNVVHHTSLQFSKTFEEGEKYELEVEVAYYSICNRWVWVKLDEENGYRFALSKETMLYDPIDCPLYTDYFCDIVTHRESEINKVLEL